MDMVCSPSSVTAVRSPLSVWNLSKQELGGIDQLSALHLRLHISLSLWEFVSHHFGLVWRGLDVGEVGYFQSSRSTLSVPKA